MTSRAYSSGVPGIIAWAICLWAISACGTSAQTTAYSDGIYYTRPAETTTVVNISQAKENTDALTEVTLGQLIDTREAEAQMPATSTQNIYLTQKFDISGSNAIVAYDPTQVNISVDPYWNTVIISDNWLPTYSRWGYYDWSFYSPWYRPYDAWYYSYYDPWYRYYDPWYKYGYYDPWYYHYAYHDPWYYHRPYDPWYGHHHHHHCDPCPPVHHDNRPRPNWNNSFYSGGGSGLGMASRSSLSTRTSSTRMGRRAP